MSTSMAAGIDHYQCFVAFYSYHPYCSLKFLIFSYTCLLNILHYRMINSYDELKYIWIMMRR